MRFARSPANVGDVGHHNGRGSGSDSQARRRQRAGVLLLASTPGASGYRSHGIDAVVFESHGGLSKQGNPLLRFLWGEAGAHAARKDPELQRFYRRKLVQKGLGKASVAVARKLGIRLWIMLRDQIEYNEFCRRGQKQQKSSDACVGMPETRYGAKSHRPID